MVVGEPQYKIPRFKMMAALVDGLGKMEIRGGVMELVDEKEDKEEEEKEEDEKGEVCGGSEEGEDLTIDCCRNLLSPLADKIADELLEDLSSTEFTNTCQGEGGSLKGVGECFEGGG